MQCSKLDIKIDITKLNNVLLPYIENIINVALLWPNEIVRIMTNYPSGTTHYTSTKRKDETWEVVDNDDYLLYTKLTKFNTRMVSVYFKKQLSWDEEVLKIIQDIGVKGTPQVAIAYASPKFRLEKHIDSRGLTRYHIPLVTNSDSYFEIFDPPTRYQLTPGELWKLDTSKEHAANNDSETKYRIHMIVDFLDD